MLEPTMTGLQFVGTHWARVWNRHDGTGMAALFHPDATYTDPFAGTIRQPSVPAMIARITELFPDFNFGLAGAVVEAAVKDTRTVALQWRMTGTQARTKKVIDLPGVDFLLFRGGLILKADTYFDRIDLQRQSGLTDDELVFKP
jgi:hypothetical protein